MSSQPTYALISTANKTGLTEFARALTALGISLIATGNTAKLLRQNEIAVRDVAEHTGMPEILNGRVKTLHPKIHAGILARREQDATEIGTHQIEPIDIVIANLYPFAQTIENDDCTLAQAIEQIDIGGPTLLRAAAKNFHDVTAVVDPNDYERILKELRDHGHTLPGTRRTLAQKVFAHTTEYDARVAQYLNQSDSTPDATPFPYTQKQTLRYGENPHQRATLYTANHSHTLTEANCIQGKALSYNNLVDADAAIACIRDFPKDQAACAIIKHATPCGVAISDNITEAYEKALRTDSTSAFGGIVALNQAITEQTALKLESQFIEVLIAPEINKQAQDILSRKKNMRIILLNASQTATQSSVRSIHGGVLIQTPDTQIITQQDCRVVTAITPSIEQWQDLLFAWNVVRHVKSNAIVYAKNGMTLGIGTGQTSRVFSAQIAALKANQANLNLSTSVMASDAFFPFADGLQAAIDNGISAVIQPGGSKRDNEVIAAATQAGIVMVFSGIRHFKH